MFLRVGPAAGAWPRRRRCVGDRDGDAVTPADQPIDGEDPHGDPTDADEHGARDAVSDLCRTLGPISRQTPGRILPSRFRIRNPGHVGATATQLEEF